MNYMKPLQIRAYEALKDMILGGHFEKGEIYSETKVSKELEISRTPIRDAVQRLAQERYIDVIP
ncbi:MAG: GntR family transcriptional regulator, partial [Synergistaceae bacterium]|nr:GntR family transcriptional regulator [Synergistaceae bacterium]